MKNDINDAIDAIIEHKGDCSYYPYKIDCKTCELFKIAYGEYRHSYNIGRIQHSDSFAYCSSQKIYEAAVKIKLEKIKEILK